MQWIETEAHKEKTKQDFANCKDSHACKRKTPKMRLPWAKKKMAKRSKVASTLAIAEESAGQLVASA